MIFQLSSNIYILLDHNIIVIRQYYYQSSINLLITFMKVILLPYVTCEKCGGYYELQKGESITDFEKCECGGNLKFTNSINESNEKPIQENLKAKKIVKSAVEKQNVEQKRFCPNCGFDNKINAKFCKKCGKEFKKGFADRFNNAINLLAVFIGLGISVLVLILGSFLYGGIVAKGAIDLITYVGLVLVTMVFLGSIVTGIIGCRDFYDGAANGVFLSLIALIIIGFVVGVALFIYMGYVSAIASAFSSLGTSAASSTSAVSNASTSAVSNTTTTSGNTSLEPIFTIIKGIIIILLVFVAGGIGGSFGVFLKMGVNKLLS
jgi:hypothetical protein